MLVIVADWSAASKRKPKPREDRCWLAWGRDHEHPNHRPDPLYQPTRIEAEATIHKLITGASDEPVLVGFDFAIGYPLSDDGTPVLPVGRELCAHTAALVADDASGVSNRFDVGEMLNGEVKARTGSDAGPFWGRPREHSHLTDLPEHRPRVPTGVSEFREVEIRAREITKQRPQSAWKLWGIGSVGSQSLLGLAAVHRLLTDPSIGPRAHLWPYEACPPIDNPVTVAEIYPSLFPECSPQHWYKDARQVVDSRDALLELGKVPMIEHQAARLEGWILGVPAPIDE